MMNCPNCHREIPADSKFCTFCGFKIPQVHPTGNQTFNAQPQADSYQNPHVEPTNYQNMGAPADYPSTAQPSQSVSYAKSYWAYLIHGIKHPSAIDDPFNKYFGLVSLLLSNLFLALIVTFMGLHSLLKFLPGAEMGFSGSFAITVFFTVFISGIIGAFFTYTMAHLVTRGFLGDKTADYMTDMTRYYHISNLGVFMLGIGLILSLLGVFTLPLVLICLIVNNVMVSISFAALIFKAHATTSFDVVYAYLTGLIVMGIVSFIAFMILYATVGFGILTNLQNSV